MPQIIVYRDPQPDSKEPLFVKKAYIGLRLTTKNTHQQGEEPLYPQGVHMVALSELIKAMNLHNQRAHQWLVEQWGDIEDVVESYNGIGILLPFPFDCCDICEVIY